MHTVHSIIKVATFNTYYIYYIKTTVTQEGDAPAYLKHGLVKPLQELNSYQKSWPAWQQVILPEKLVKCDPTYGHTLRSIYNEITPCSLCDCHLTLHLTVVGMVSFQLKFLITTRLSYKFTEEISIKANFSWCIFTVLIRAFNFNQAIGL